MSQWVDIIFDCLPLRSIGRLDIPLDASPKYQQKCMRIKSAMEKHGSHNAYYLHNAKCVFHLTNHPDIGAITFSFEGTVLTDESDKHCVSGDLQVELLGETCDWLTEPIVNWFGESVTRSVWSNSTAISKRAILIRRRSGSRSSRNRSINRAGIWGCISRINSKSD